MDIKKQIKLKKIKTLTLAGLMGLAGCRADMEPESPKDNKTTQNETTVHNIPNVSQDQFMKHLGDVETARFYLGPDGMGGFTTDGMGNVNSFYLYEEAHNDGEQIHFDAGKSFGSRAPLGEISTDGTAHFLADHNYEFYVGGQGVFEDPRENWAIKNVSEELYNKTFKNMSWLELAEYAKNHLDTVPNCDKGHINNIYNAIKDSLGSWTYKPGEIIPIHSKGPQIGLNHSDIGVTHGSSEDAVAESPDSRHYYTYIMEQPSKKVAAPTETTRFQGTAYAVLDKQKQQMYGDSTMFSYLISTDSLGATFIHTANGIDTIKMPFKGWYITTVIINPNSNSLKIQFDGNSSDAKTSMFGQNEEYISTNIMTMPDTSDYKLDWTYAEADNSMFCITTNYFGTEDMIPTGLDMVYATPARRTSAPNNYPAKEVTVKGMRNIGFNDGSSILLNFVFGGVKQNQR